MKEKFTENAKEVFRLAENIATEMSCNYIGTEHILLGLLNGKGVAATTLSANHVTDEKVRDLMEQLLQMDGGVMVQDAKFTLRAQKIKEDCVHEAERLRSKSVGTEHILLTLLKAQDCVAIRLLNTIGVNMQKLYIDVLTATGMDMNSAKSDYMTFKSKNKAKSTTPMLDQFSRNLSALASDGRLDPVVGREKEIERLIQIISRRTKNNPCLVGEPGVGKTAIVEGLAQKISDGSVPEVIANKKVLILDLSAMVAGSKYRGEFEERIKRVIKEVSQDGSILLFIDELHTLIGAGGAEGAMDAANILKPALARGEIQIMGATTIVEYRKYIEKDAALERRFQPVMVEEPTEAETLDILEGVVDKYEEHHNVTITKEALAAAVKLSVRYINDRFLPDKAIDVMDEAASHAKLGSSVKSKELIELEKKNAQLDIEKEEAIIAEDYDEAMKIKQAQEVNREKIAKLMEQEEKNKQKVEVTESDIAKVIALWTKIPVEKLDMEEASKLRNLEENLHARVIGQDEAVTAVAKAVRRGRVGLKDPNRPIGSFLFLGPTGVGKTELSKALADCVFGTEKSMIRVDMSEYMEKHSVSKLIGSPPGYVGFEEGGQLSEKVRRHPYSVILFDEIEKAHEDVFNILLQVLDDGHITDSQGRKVSFKNAVIIMTSNAGASRIVAPKNLGFSTEKDAKADHEKMKSGVMEEVKRLFKPEFLNRIDETIVFHSLEKDDIKKIVRLMLKQLGKRVKEQMLLELQVEDEVVDYIAEESFDITYGARPIRRTIQTKVEDALADAVLDGKVKAGNTVSLYMEDKTISFKTL
ncbi:MAG: ATP-dependent Clp protease ATP-binding subunit [Lachnospiraceae bacterium]|nr:ATP-dependent Clp protease ATP-binding subunit [Lachnospiraceae bacterium]